MVLMCCGHLEQSRSSRKGIEGANKSGTMGRASGVNFREKTEEV